MSSKGILGLSGLNIGAKIKVGYLDSKLHDNHELYPSAHFRQFLVILCYMIDVTSAKSTVPQSYLYTGGVEELSSHFWEEGYFLMR